ncbi:hypothetical protein [Paraburkholderia kirstenboschensis]|uniref:Uncharacterized protein n=1 Tax=Paraburkholderia kirstenboschensis TaxID=1245436 RepID=A0ABZ0EF29_9BURK|nr:hypothetical protein [Paraburkholderia kirstenboschensis]WOD15826.1 hypothetical protein RW095_21555 [Paraburkholderia kirstenboschensis]
MNFIIKILVVVLFMIWLPNARPANNLDIPSLSQFSPAYISTQAWLAPCGDYSGETDIETQRMVAEARRRYPKGACADVAVPSLLFKAVFFQYASIAVVGDPGSLFEIVQAQNAKLASCKNTACLKATLRDVIKKLEPIYLNSKRSAESVHDRICKVRKTIDDRAALRLGPGARSVIASIKQQCSANGALISACSSRHGNFLWADCNIDTRSSQVNSQSWLFRLTSESPVLLLHADDGSFDQTQNWCNGLPELKTEARENMGESDVVIYRFDGKKYRTHFSYILESIGSEWQIASNPVLYKIHCH